MRAEQLLTNQQSRSILRRNVVHPVAKAPGALDTTDVLREGSSCDKSKRGHGARHALPQNASSTTIYYTSIYNIIYYNSLHLFAHDYHLTHLDWLDTGMELGMKGHVSTMRIAISVSLNNQILAASNGGQVCQLGVTKT